MYAAIRGGGGEACAAIYSVLDCSGGMEFDGGCGAGDDVIGRDACGVG